ncbi:Hypothetical protein FKW44_013700 [Caligus rogercresseyi]|uniref:Uncharacterized protein n=1 Tax=Caligus rogercresseyi TaxID=217165 RepID=A0A7T8JZW3_CALRO|nr:Hypothetical protein FKW44_013700 [Caligus rogercresseyi]
MVSDWYKSSNYEELFEKLRFGDVIEIMRALNSHFCLYVGNRFGKEDHNVVFTKGDKHYKCFSTKAIQCTIDAIERYSKGMQRTNL